MTTVPSCLVVFFFFKAMLELGCMKMAGGHSGHEQLGVSKELSSVSFPFASRKLIFQPHQEGGGIPKLCSPALIKYNWINMWLWTKAWQFFKYKDNTHLLFISEIPLRFYFTTSQHDSTRYFIFSNPDKAECCVWLFEKAIVHVVKTSFTLSDEVVSEECLFFCKSTEETGFKARSFFKILVSVFKQCV